MKLIDHEGREVKKGSIVRCFRGEEYTLLTPVFDRGKVVVKLNRTGNVWEYIPAVFGLKFEGKHERKNYVRP
jgi:hypothetical protein